MFDVKQVSVLRIVKDGLAECSDGNKYYIAQSCKGQELINKLVLVSEKYIITSLDPVMDYSEIDSKEIKITNKRAYSFIFDRLRSVFSIVTGNYNLVVGDAELKIFSKANGSILTFSTKNFFMSIKPSEVIIETMGTEIQFTPETISIRNMRNMNLTASELFVTVKNLTIKSISTLDVKYGELAKIIFNAIELSIADATLRINSMDYSGYSLSVANSGKTSINSSLIDIGATGSVQISSTMDSIVEQSTMSHAIGVETMALPIPGCFSVNAPVSSYLSTPTVFLTNTPTYHYCNTEILIQVLTELTTILQTMATGYVPYSGSVPTAVNTALATWISTRLPTIINVKIMG